MSEIPYDDGEPLWEVDCECGSFVNRWKSDPPDVFCEKCGALYNAFGQRLRDDALGNPSMYDDEISDLDGYEIQHAGD